MPFTRASSPIKADYLEPTSPDPLDDSPRLESFSVASLKESATDSATDHQHYRHGKSNSFELSPGKTVTEQTVSPWRIRVTVEAEPETAPTNQTTGVRSRMVTRTTKIPLRDASSPTSQIENATQRECSNVWNKSQRRSATPDTGRTNRRPSVTDLDIVVLGDDGVEDEWGVKKRSPRKTKQAKPAGANFDRRRATTGRRKSSGTNFEISKDRDVDRNETINTQRQLDSKSPELRNIDTNQVSVRRRADSIKAGTDQEEGQNAGQQRGVLSSHIRPRLGDRKVSTNSTRSYPTPSPTASDFGNSDNRDTTQEAEAYEALREFDTVMESEGFTMIDLDTLPSIKHMRSSPEPVAESATKSRYMHYQVVDDRTSRASEEESQDMSQQPNISYPQLPKTGLSGTSQLTSSSPDLESRQNENLEPCSVGHLQLPSSTEIHCQRHVTPQPYPSPKLPSPPKLLSNHKRSSPNPRKVVTAGRALQGALDPSLEETIEEDATFEGFDPETKRELRAGLRFGEELAKRQHDGTTRNTDRKRPVQIERQSLSNDSIWRREAVVQRVSPSAVTDIAELSPPNQSLVTTPQSKVLDTEQGCTKLLNTEARLQREWQSERDDVIKQANAVNESQIIVINSDDDDTTSQMAGQNNNNHDRNDFGEETEGDIWLAEARDHSSPKEGTGRGPVLEYDSGTVIVKPRRSDIPSPWRRGEEISMDEDQTSSMVGGDTSMSGFLWKQNNDMRFGADIVAQPDRVRASLDAPARRRSGDFNLGGTAERTAHHSRPEQEIYGEDDLEDEDTEISAEHLTWRNATDVVEEETMQFEAELAEKEVSQHRPLRAIEENEDVYHTRLHETNLHDIPEQDLSSSPSASHPDAHARNGNSDEDMLGSAGYEADSSLQSEPFSESESFDVTPATYRQRTSISPSKERPHTPRSALKGGRLSSGDGLGLGISLRPVQFEADNAARKVVWAKRSSCMNEEWEESSRSIRSHGDSLCTEDSALPLETEQLPITAADVETKSTRKVELPVEDGISNKEAERGASTNSAPEGRKGWFGWLRKENDTQASLRDSKQERESASPLSKNTPPEELRSAVIQNHHKPSSTERYQVENDTSSSGLASSPLSHHSHLSQYQHYHHQPKQTRQQQQKPSFPSTGPDSAHTTKPQSQPNREKERGRERERRKIPSYLLPPSYPSDPTRDPSIPLSTHGEFTNTHFRTLHIIYKKSMKAAAAARTATRFHAPEYPSDIRPEIRKLVQGSDLRSGGGTGGGGRESGRWTLEVDEVNSMGEVFEFAIRENEARVLERFCREVEFGHTCERGGQAREGQQNTVDWGWTMEQLATWLGRIAVGEVVRAEEKETEKLKSKSRGRG